MLLRSDMIAALAGGQVHAKVQQAMREDFPVASPAESLLSVLRRLHETELAIVPVIDNGRLVGLITLENMTEYAMIHAALSNATNGSNGRLERMSVEFRGPALPIEQ
jgi:predicted transcriptional regulator